MKQFTPWINHFDALIKLSNKFPDSLEEVEVFANKLVKLLELTIVKEVIHKFQPSGITLVYILSQSHLAIHTWPEYKTIHVDLVSCTEITQEVFEEALKTFFKNEKNCEITTGKSNL
jgi:S-adenosylmethionine/arginine decarboxylase-like enzyme